MKSNNKNSISLFNVLISIFVTAGVLVFFVYNIIHVNNLAVDINNNKIELGKQITVNNSLQTEIERLSTYDNIKPAAVDKLKLINISNKTKRIVINKSELENLK